MLVFTIMLSFSSISCGQRHDLEEIDFGETVELGEVGIPVKSEYVIVGSTGFGLFLTLSVTAGLK